MFSFIESPIYFQLDKQIWLRNLALFFFVCWFFHAWLIVVLYFAHQAYLNAHITRLSYTWLLEMHYFLSISNWFTFLSYSFLIVMYLRPKYCFDIINYPIHEIGSWSVLQFLILFSYFVFPSIILWFKIHHFNHVNWHILECISYKIVVLIHKKISHPFSVHHNFTLFCLRLIAHIYRWILSNFRYRRT